MDDLRLKVLNSNWKDFTQTSKQLPPLPCDIPPHLRQFFTGRTGGTVRPYTTSTAWWIAATGFPLLAGTLGPIANLFSVCALVQTWRIDKNTGERISDPKWFLALNSISLAFAVIANVFLLLNFARRVRYYVAQLVTITLWYISAIFLLVPFALLTSQIYDEERHILSQSYYYALIAGTIYSIISTFLLLNVIGASSLSISVAGGVELLVLRKRYDASFKILSIAQRSIMLQTISFVLYVALMAGVFSAVEGWSFVDALYWVDYTLLTIGLGSDFTPVTELGRFLLIPLSLFGFIFLGLVVNSVRRLLIERAREKRRERNLITRREKWQRKFDHNMEAMWKTHSAPAGRQLESDNVSVHARLPRDTGRLDHDVWLKKEFQLMRHIEAASEMLEKYSSAGVALLGFLLVWIGGSLVFWRCERDIQGWTYPNSIYFSYVAITTIGFGDFYPSSTAGKPFFVLWSLVAVPSVTALIGGVGETVGSVVEDATTWFWKSTILPEPQGINNQSQGAGDWYGHGRSDSDVNNDEGIPAFAARVPCSPSRSPTHDEPQFGSRRHIDERHRLILKLSREMVKLVASLTQGGKMDPYEKKYTWEEWQRWLQLLAEMNEREQGAEREAKGESLQEELSSRGSQLQEIPRTDSDPSAPKQRLSPLATDSDNAITVFSPDKEGWQEGEARENEDRAWLWLSDQGPLFSPVPEAVWIMEKLNEMLERVVSREEASLDKGSKDPVHYQLSRQQHRSAES